MAKSSAEIQRELDVKRLDLYARSDRLRGRVARDIGGVRDEAKEDVGALTERTRGYLHDAEELAVGHPWLTIAAGVGVGVVLGMTTHSSGAKHNGGHADETQEENDGDGLVSRSFGALIGAASGPLIDEVREQLSGPLDEIKSAIQDSVGDLVQGLTGGNNGSDHRHKVRDHVAA